LAPALISDLTLSQVDLRSRERLARLVSWKLAARRLSSRFHNRAPSETRTLPSRRTLVAPGAVRKQPGSGV